MKYEGIISGMTLEEKCAMLSGAGVFRTRGTKDIPAVWLSDGPHGLRKQAGESDHLGLNPSEKATCFPTASCIANSWDTELGEEIGHALGREAASQKVAVLLGPGLNMKRNPLCGRNFEYFSEDPHLAGKMAAAYVRGIQAQGVSACPKHFAVNNQELRRMATDSVVDERTLREIYLAGFEIAVKEGKPGCIMTSYNMINGEYANEHKHLLKDILRGEWGYDKAVVTDWGGSNDHALGVKYGSTLEMPAPGLDSVRELMSAVESGKIGEKDIDARLDELIEMVISAQDALSNPPEIDQAAHHALARKAARESIVLLKNQDSLLPLAKGTKAALIGDFAIKPRYQGAGSSVVNAYCAESLQECIGDSSIECIGTAQGYLRSGEKSENLIREAVKLAKKAEVALLCLGLTELDECEGLDRRHMRMAENQIELLEAVAATGVKTVVLLHAGSVVETPWLERCDALVYAALGGQAGASAMLDVLTGKVNPSGKLAETWAMEYVQTPSIDHFCGEGRRIEYREGMFIGYRYYQKAGQKVCFPFGFGLSYTNFEYENLRASADGVTLTVRNGGSTDGAEVVQLYVHKENSLLPMPEQELRGFKKVFLKAGESREVSIPLDETAYRVWNAQANEWCCEGGEYELRVGASCEDIRLRAAVQVQPKGAQLPDTRSTLPTYHSGRVQKVSKEEFEALLGRSLPKEKAVIDRNMTLGEMTRTRAPLGWLLGSIINGIVRHNLKKGSADLNMLFVANMPLRGIAKMSGGMVSMGMVDGLVMELKGFWIIGLCRTVYELVKNLILNARQKKRLS